MKRQYLFVTLSILLLSAKANCQSKSDTTFYFGNYLWTVTIPAGFRLYSEEGKKALADKETQNLKQFNGTGNKGYVDTKIFIAEYSWGNSFSASLASSTDNEIKWKTQLYQARKNTYLFRQQRNPGTTIDSVTTTIKSGIYNFSSFEVTLKKTNYPTLHILSMECLLGSMVLHIDVVYKDEKLWPIMRETIINSKISKGH